MSNLRMPVYYLAHGGGPWPWMSGPHHDAHALLAQSLRELPAQVGTTPAAVLMVSAHWEAPQFTTSSHPRPPMLYDYYGFPPNTYEVQYPAPGHPALAARVQALLGDAGIAAAQDAERGFDHATFVPMAVAWPDASVPVVQLSLKDGLDPEAHLAAGRALAPLRDEGVLIIGSGLSYHNLRLLRPEGYEASAAFDQWLTDTLIGKTAAERAAALTQWTSAPSARVVHPREEHLLPLMVAAGAAGDDAARRSYHEPRFMGAVTVSSFRFSNNR
ncbi:MAG: dioxygenase [Burkholderiaceae bacterium]|nr:dioxygenase [Burkholderiaceae bacterium]